MLYFLGTTQDNMKRVLKTAGGWGGGGFRVATPGWHQSSLKVCHILNEASLILCYTSLVPLRITWNECWKQQGGGGGGGGSEWLRQDDINLVLKYVTF